MQKPKTTECPYPVRVTAPEKNAARAESDRVRCGKMLRRLMPPPAAPPGRARPAPTVDMAITARRMDNPAGRLQFYSFKSPS